MSDIVVTYAELEAFGLLNGGTMSSSDGWQEAQQAGNRIIALAERIKAERAAAMLGGAALHITLPRLVSETTEEGK